MCACEEQSTPQVHAVAMNWVVGLCQHASPENRISVSALLVCECSVCTQVLLKPACLVPRSHPAVGLLLELGFARIVPQLASTGPRQSATAWPEGAAYLDCLITVTAPIITAITLAEAAYEIQSDLLAPRPLDDRCGLIFALHQALQGLHTCAQVFSQQHLSPCVAAS